MTKALNSSPLKGLRNSTCSAGGRRGACGPLGAAGGLSAPPGSVQRGPAPSGVMFLTGSVSRKLNKQKQQEGRPPPRPVSFAPPQPSFASHRPLTSQCACVSSSLLGPGPGVVPPSLDCPGSPCPSPSFSVKWKQTLPDRAAGRTKGRWAFRTAASPSLQFPSLWRPRAPLGLGGTLFLKPQLLGLITPERCCCAPLFLTCPSQRYEIPA